MLYKTAVLIVRTYANAHMEECTYILLAQKIFTHFYDR